jgi:hypothetical protein
VLDGLLGDMASVRDHPDNPANRWRAENPYSSWATYLGIDVG